MRIKNIYFILIITLLLSTKPKNFSECINSSIDWIKNKWHSGIKNIKKKVSDLKKLIVKNPKKSAIILLTTGAGIAGAGYTLKNTYGQKKPEEQKIPILIEEEEKTPSEIKKDASWWNLAKDNPVKTAAVVTLTGYGLKRGPQYIKRILLKRKDNTYKKDDPYNILGIKKDASQEEIKKAWKMSLRKNHPDMNPGNIENATDMSKKINAAYQQLKNR